VESEIGVGVWSGVLETEHGWLACVLGPCPLGFGTWGARRRGLPAGRRSHLRLRQQPLRRRRSALEAERLRGEGVVRGAQR
jgi:hypothetical protein